MERMLGCLERELVLRQEEMQGHGIQSIYLGGGTPSLLSSEMLESLLRCIHMHYHIEGNAECTLEANPDDLSAAKLKELAEAGVNRLSIGIQSLDDSALAWMNRSHNAAQALQCLKDASEAGFDNVSVDMIYGLPQLGLDAWREQLKRVAEMGVQHLSAYCLTVEDKTVLGTRVRKGLEADIDEEAAAEQFEYLVNDLIALGFEQYEVSNFARAQRYSLHNSSYWQEKRYIGIGPSSHSYSTGMRSWNIANNARYMASIERDELPCEREVLSRKDSYNECLMTGLRTKWGIDLKEIHRRFDLDFEQLHREKIRLLQDAGLAVLRGHRFRLTAAGFFRADGIASDFFILDP